MALLLLPEIALCIGIAFFLFLTLVEDRLAEVLSSRFAGVFACIVLVSSLLAFQSQGMLFWSSYKIDVLSQSFKIVLSLALLFTILSSGKQTPIPSDRRAEYFVFLLTAALGMMMLASAVELLTFYVALELSAYSLYLLVPLRDYRWNAEAGIKYIVFGATASGLLLYGFSILLGLTQTTYLSEMIDRIPLIASEPAFLLGAFLIVVALFFKLSAVPLHFWAPDVYEAATTTVAAYIATASKTAAVVILLRLFWTLGVPEVLASVIGVFAFLSMTVGNAAALIQRDVKRLLAYSSIAQGGYILVGLLSGTLDAYSAVFFYAVAYVLMNIGAFLVTIKVGEAYQTDNPSFQHFNGLSQRSPLLALLLLVSLLSLGGIPPLIGFTGKWFLFAAAMKEGHSLLVLAGVINSVISLFYYLVLVKHAYFFKSDDPGHLPMGLRLRAACLTLFLAIILLGVLPGKLLETAQAAFMISS